VNRPVPSILGLADVQLSIESHSHDTVASVGSSSNHDKGVESIESSDSKEVARLDQGLINRDLMSFPLLQSPLHVILDEDLVLLDHVFGYMRSNDGQVRVKANASTESHNPLEY